MAKDKSNFISLEGGPEIAPSIMNTVRGTFGVNLGAKEVEFSVGTGRGNAVNRLSVADLSATVANMRKFDPSAVEEAATDPAAIFAQTARIVREEGGPPTVEFRLSYEPRSRVNKVPLSDWDEFVGYLDNAANKAIPAAIKRAEEQKKTAAK